jgi:phosphoglycolate phosphatase
MKAYKPIIFDFDGPLADSALWFIRTLNDIAKTHGFRSVNEHELEMLRGKPNREIISYLGIRFWQVPAIARELRK